MALFLRRLMAAFSRRKVFADVEKSPLLRALGVFDLTALGVGATLGVGVYVLAGEVAKNSAGPAVILSFFIAAVASVFAGICYAEFGARVPRAGSAYVYSYVSIGELIAFIIGWNLILEYCIGAASVVRGLSTYVDSLLDNVMSDWFLSVMPINVSFLSPYPDLFAFGVTMVFAVGLAFGIKESSLVNNIFTVLNLGVVTYVIICGAINADFANWSIPKEDIPPEANGGEGGFFPFGFSGVIKGAAKCFYGFIGFDCIATTGEEAKNPQRTIPLSIVLSLSIIFLAYFGVSSVLTLMWPYYLQDAEAPLPFVFEQIGWYTAKWIVSIGAIFGLLASLFGSLYPLPRILYAMSSDGLLFGFMGRIHPRFQTPVWGTLISGLVTASMAAFFDLSQLVSMMSIGTLMAYSIVAFCVTLLRFKEVSEGSTSGTSNQAEESSFRDLIGQLVNAKRLVTSNRLSERIVMWLLIDFCLLCIGFLSITIWWYDGLSAGDAAPISLLSVVGVLMIAALVFISLQPRSSAKLSFTVPLVPFIPAVSIMINIYLMLALDVETWWRFLIWMVIGFAIYFGYGIRKSKETPRYKARQAAVGETNLNYLNEEGTNKSTKEL